MQISRFAIGEGAPCFVIAEAGVNHNGDLALAKRLVDVAVGAGANGVKFQSFRAENIASRRAPHHLLLNALRSRKCRPPRRTRRSVFQDRVWRADSRTPLAPYRAYRKA